MSDVLKGIRAIDEELASHGYKIDGLQRGLLRKYFPEAFVKVQCRRPDPHCPNTVEWRIVMRAVGTGFDRVAKLFYLGNDNPISDVIITAERAALINQMMSQCDANGMETPR